MSEHLAVSVVIPCRNEGHGLEACLQSILQQVPPPGDFEVIVADGMSNDGTREVLARMAAANPRLRLVENPSRTTPCGMNRAIRAARGQWIAIMGAHNRYSPDYLVQCLEVALATGAENVGGAMRCEGASLVQRAIAAAHHSAFGTGGARWHDPDYEGPCDTVFGGFYQRQVFERIGLFDEELVRNQDDEFNLRLNRAGGRVWHSPKPRSWYRPRKSLPALFSRCAGDGYWKVRVIQKHRRPASWRHLVPGTFVFALLSLAGTGLLASVLGTSGSALREVGRLAGMGLGAALALYLMTTLAAAVLTARKHGWALFPVLPAVFVCYHVGYGYGFLRGLWDFVLRRPRPESRAANTPHAVNP